MTILIENAYDRLKKKQLIREQKTPRSIVFPRLVVNALELPNLEGFFFLVTKE